ncbi:MAG: thiolase family protein [Desulfobacterales bacterium]|jgi:acetyl-CoA C-acetyltransferase|nr:thiolase family protein [Desulfobacteraceae bacterium]MBT7086005.1 thiolase family protein [Desulfobacterales bacterium]MBT7698059.1 thiolase family protein [Desulfobacterales bacterium]
MKKNRNVGIVGVGQSAFSSHREDVNQPELINEAVNEALEHAGITLNDVDCVVHGNMELFEMVHQPDMWHTLGTGAYGKETIRVTTGGTTGATLVCVADNLVASGMHDVVMAIGFEKLQEGNTTAGITNMSDPLWGRRLQTGALTGVFAQKAIDKYGEEKAKKAAMKYRIIMDKHAMKNPKAHRRLGLEFDEMDTLAENSPTLVGDLKMIHMCSQSDGACVVIFASEEKAKEICKQPAWIKDHITVHREEAYCAFGDAPHTTTHEYAAQKLFKRNGITSPVDELDVFEMYDPSCWWGIDWISEFMMISSDEAMKLIEDDEIMIGGKIPFNPSGGVIASNPIGATAMVRVAEAALQIMGDAGEHQVPGEVNQALASGFGGVMWTVLLLLTKEAPVWNE